jgi:hypothetical protein
MVVRDVRKMPAPLKNREFVHRVINYRIAEDEYLVLAYPVDDSDLDPEERKETSDVGPTVRARATRVVKIVGIGETQCRVSVVSSGEFGAFPTFVTKYLVPYVAMGAVSYPIKYFLKSVHMIDCDAATAEKIAHVMVDVYADKYKNVSLALDFMMLREFNTRWTWGKKFWGSLLKMRHLPGTEVSKDLKNLNTSDAAKVAIGFASCVKAHPGEYATMVREYGERYPCVAEMLGRYRWLRPMLLVFAKRLKVHGIGSVVYRMCGCARAVAGVKKKTKAIKIGDKAKSKYEPNDVRGTESSVHELDLGSGRGRGKNEDEESDPEEEEEGGGGEEEEEDEEEETEEAGTTMEEKGDN